MKNNILFLTLRVFGATGGIEKVCRVAGKSFFEISKADNNNTTIFCLHDHQANALKNKYFPPDIFKGFAGSRLKFICAAVFKSRACDTVILSHINLIMIGWLIKKLSPSRKIIMFAHGIEIWGGMSGRKKKMLKCCDHFIPVSQFTSEKIQEIHQIAPGKCEVINNCLDPFLPALPEKQRIREVKAFLNLSEANKIIFTLSRLSSQEKYKGYDKVIEAIALLKKELPGLRYILAGKYDRDEKAHVEKIIAGFGLKKVVKITGFLPDEDLAVFFSAADVYVMPSLQEGFGIVFIEAMYYGVPVIAGNLDGSVDALCNGKLGILTDPLDADLIAINIRNVLANKAAFKPDRELLISAFGYNAYKSKLQALLQKVRA